MIEKVGIIPLHVRMLHQELERRKSHNSRYSMRAFSKALGWNPSALSKILEGKQELSIPACTDVLRALRLTVAAARLFLASVAQDKANRASALLSMALISEYGDLKEERYDKITTNFAEDRLSEDVSLSISKDLISVLSLDWQFVHVGESLAAAMGKIPCELIGLNWTDSGFSDELISVLKDQQAFAENQDTESNFRFAIGEGCERKVYHRLLAPVFDKSGVKRSYVSCIRDTTWETFTFDAIQEIHSSIILETTLQHIVAAGVPMLADACVLQLYSPLGELLPVAARHVTRDLSDDVLTIFKASVGEFESHSIPSQADWPDYDVTNVQKSFGDLEVNKLINVRLGNPEKKLGVLTYLAVEGNLITDDRVFAILKIKQASALAISNAMIRAG